MGNRNLELTIVDNPDRYLDILSREDKGGRLYLPYWAYLWESGIGLARYVSELGDTLLGKHILEVGCGFGLVGIAASQAGGDVVFTDFEHDALLFSRHNAERNNVHAADYVQMDWNMPCLQRKFDVILASDVIYEKQN
ncbi:methyltransferase [Candidatus Poribacteria bacterium]|nr:methyltransferase [Candidatus Poribacteria bacterium]